MSLGWLHFLKCSGPQSVQLYQVSCFNEKVQTSPQILHVSSSVDATGRITALHGSKFELNSYKHSCIIQENCLSQIRSCLSSLCPNKEVTENTSANSSKPAFFLHYTSYIPRQYALVFPYSLNPEICFPQSNLTHSAPSSIYTATTGWTSFPNFRLNRNIMLSRYCFCFLHTQRKVSRPKWLNTKLLMVLTTNYWDFSKCTQNAEIIKDRRE